MPAIVESHETLGQSYRPAAPRLSRRILISTVRLILVLGLGALAGGGWYLARKGFGRSWRGLVVAELRKHGVEASVRRLTLDPFRGLIAQDVRIFDYRDRENTIAQISRISLDVNYAALLQHQPFLNALDVRGARVTLPLPHGADRNAPHAEITNLNGHIYFPPEQIYVSQADGVFCGIHVSMTGQVIKRSNYQASRQITDEEWQSRLRLLQRAASEANKLRFTAEPQIQIKFSGDLADLENARVETSLSAEQLQRGSYVLQKLALAAEFGDQTLTVRQCEWRDHLGQISASAVWRRETDELNIEAQSSLDITGALQAFGLGNLVPDVNLLTPPALDLSLRANPSAPSPNWQVTGHIGFDRFNYKQIPFLGLTADFASDGQRTLIRNARVRHLSGELTAQVLDAPGDFRLDLASTIDANALRSLAPAGIRQFASEWDWPHASNVQLAIRGPNRDAGSWRGTGTLQLERGRFRAVAFNSASAEVHFGNGAVTYQNFRVTRDEGVATGTFTYDFAHHETRLANVRSTLRPTEAIFWVDPKLLKAVAPYEFARPPIVLANGVYRFGGATNTRLEVTVDSPAKMDYAFLGKTVPFDRISGKLLFTDNHLAISELSGIILSGMARGSADISLVKNHEQYSAELSVEGVDFPRLTELYFNSNAVHGVMNGHFGWTGVGADPRSIEGKGEIETRNGDIFAIPIFGPLSDILEKILPGVGYRTARRASMSFAVKDGILRTPDFHVDGGSFGMVGHGEAHFLEDKIDFDVRVDASGAGFVLTPFYKFFEYRADGSLSHPRWRPKNF